MSDDERASRPDFTRGIRADTLHDGDLLLGRVAEDDVILARTASGVFAIGAHCTHYHGPLAEGLIIDGTVRCPWHHACFDLQTGDAVRAPGLDPIPTWRVEQRGDLLFVTEKTTATARVRPASDSDPKSVLIIGGGAAGLAAADMLRREGYTGPVVIVSADDSPPVDRPNLSKDYLAGEAQEDWIPLRPPEFYTEHRIELVLGSVVTDLDTASRTARLANGTTRDFDALLLATGAEPVRLPVAGADAPTVHYLRSFSDSRAIVAAAQAGTRAVVVGASFIGLEVAAALRARGITVDVVAPEALPLGRIMGPQLGQMVRDLHEKHGVTFHLEQSVTAIRGRSVVLSGGSTLDSDFVVIGIGVRASTALAERAGLTLDRGINVNEYLETSVPRIFAAGDAARWLDRKTGERRRVEHWVVAERMGQVAARNMLGRKEPFDAAPFFWSQHYDVTIRYVGYAEQWDTADVVGDLAARDAAVSFTKDGRVLAVATVGRDRDNLRAEEAMERDQPRGPAGSTEARR